MGTCSDGCRKSSASLLRHPHEQSFSEHVRDFFQQQVVRFHENGKGSVGTEPGLWLFHLAAVFLLRDFDKFELSGFMNQEVSSDPQLF